MQVLKIIGAISAGFITACAQENTPMSSSEINTATDLAADTADLPNTDIFLARLSLEESIPKLSGIRNVTNAVGYDNQPSFLPGLAAFYYASEGASRKTDIWKYDIGTNKTVEIFHSPNVSENSPKAAPNAYGISYIQGNEAGDVSRVHHAPTDGGDGEPVVSLAPLGYYAWLSDATKLGVYFRGDPASLQLVDVLSGATEVIAENIGRSLQATPDGDGLYFTQPDESHTFRVMHLDLSENGTVQVASLPAESQDYFIVFSRIGEPRGMFSASGAVLYFLDMSIEDAVWREVADFASDGLSNISRIAVSDDLAWITLVAEPES